MKILLALALLAAPAAFAAVPKNGAAYCEEVQSTPTCSFVDNLQCLLIGNGKRFQDEALRLCSRIVHAELTDCDTDLLCLKTVGNKRYSADELAACAATSNSHDLIACLKK